jgi:hypothetical protein
MKTTAVTVSAVLAALSGASQAAFINGSINISLLADPGFIFNTAANSVTFGPGNNATVNGVGTSDYLASGVLGKAVHYNSFNYGASPGPLSVTPLWFTTGPPLASFDLLSITSITEAVNGRSVTLEGTGTAYLNGFTPTVGNWSFAATQVGTGASATFNWSSNNESSHIPDGGATFGLLGISILGMEAIRKFSPKKK